MKFTMIEGCLVEGCLTGVKSEKGGVNPHLVVEMSVTDVADPIRVTLDTFDLSMIVRLAQESTIQDIRDAVRWR